MNSRKRPVVIAHRGASGYLPEHTLPAKALAFAMGADFLEQDVVASRDDALVVLHDIHLDRVTDVAERFPERRRDDGRWYVRDFDLDELRALRVRERENAQGKPVYPGRYPARSGNFRIHTLAEELELLASLNAATAHSAGAYPEIKRPAWHRSEGIDIAPLLLETLDEFGYRGRTAEVFVQCFDAGELVRIRDELHSELPLIQLIGENSWQESDTDYRTLRTGDGLRSLAATVDGIGPFVEQLYRLQDGRPVSSGLAETARRFGLAVHPFTFRSDALPHGFDELDTLIEFVVGLGVDGLFTDFPDRALKVLRRLGE